MQQRNFWLFLVLSAIILAAWTWVQFNYGPQPKSDDEKPQAQSTDKKPDDKTDDPKAKKLSAEAAEQVRAVGRLWLAGFHPRPGAEQALALNTVVATGKEEIAAAIKEADEIKAAEDAKKQPSTPEVKTIAFGVDGSYLQGVLTMRGAGVQRLTLAKFQAASAGGLPVVDSNGQPVPLDLIPDNPYLPSFLMYHYADASIADPDKARPDNTLGERIWELESDKKENDTHTIVFKTKGPPGFEYLILRKTYALRAKDYHIGLKIDIEDTGTADTKRAPFRYQLAGAHGLPIEGEWYTYTYRNAMIGMVDARSVLWRTMEDANRISHGKGGDRIPSGDRGSSAVQYAGIVTAFFASVITVSDQQEEGVNAKNILAYARPTHESEEKLCFVDRVDGDTAEIRLQDEKRTKPPLMVKMLPPAKKQLASLHLKGGDQAIVNLYTVYQDGKEIHVAHAFRQGTVLKPFLEDITVRVVSDSISLKTGEKVGHQFLLYHGPVKVTQLSYVADKAGDVDPALIERYAQTLHLVTLTDYPSVSYFAWWSDIIIFFTRLMHWLLDFLYRLVPIEGITIILLTVIVRGLMFPISRKQAMTAMRMQELAPEMRKIQEKYKNDVQAKNQATMELYRKHNVNPLGGCLPLVLQLPIFLGLYFALQESIRFRLAPFLWIDSLTAPDMLIYWSESIPIISDPDNQPGGTRSWLANLFTVFYLGPYFNILPIVAVVIMLISQKLMMPPAQDEQQEMQQKMMTYMMVFIGIMFYKVAAGLSIYFIATTLWGIAERKFLPKKKPLTPAAPEPAAPTKPGQPKDLSKLNPAQRRKLKAKGGKKEEQPDTAVTKVKNWWEEILKQAKKK